MAGKLSQGVTAQPNLTPMLDMVFQLITFFVLVVNFRSAEIDFNLKLPVVGSARPVTEPYLQRLSNGLAIRVESVSYLTGPRFRAFVKLTLARAKSIIRRLSKKTGLKLAPFDVIPHPVGRDTIDRS